MGIYGEKLYIFRLVIFHIHRRKILVGVNLRSLFLSKRKAWDLGRDSRTFSGRTYLFWLGIHYFVSSFSIATFFGKKRRVYCSSFFKMWIFLILGWLNRGFGGLPTGRQALLSIFKQDEFVVWKPRAWPSHLQGCRKKPVELSRKDPNSLPLWE